MDAPTSSDASPATADTRSVLHESACCAAAPTAYEQQTRLYVILYRLCVDETVAVLRWYTDVRVPCHYRVTAVRHALDVRLQRAGSLHGASGCLLTVYSLVLASVVAG